MTSDYLIIFYFPIDLAIRNKKPKKAKNIPSSEDGVKHSSKSMPERKVEIDSTKGFKDQANDKVHLINILITIRVDDNENENAVPKRIDSSTKIDKACVESWKSDAMKNCKERYSVLRGIGELSENIAQLKDYRENDSENDDFILDSKLTNLPVSDEDKIRCVYHWIRKASGQKNKLSDMFLYLRTLKD